MNQTQHGPTGLIPAPADLSLAGTTPALGSPSPKSGGRPARGSSRTSPSSGSPAIVFVAPALLDRPDLLGKAGLLPLLDTNDLQALMRSLERVEAVHAAGISHCRLPAGVTSLDSEEALLQLLPPPSPRTSATLPHHCTTGSTAPGCGGEPERSDRGPVPALEAPAAASAPTPTNR